MADQTKSIIAGGSGDYTTIQGWEDASDVSTGFWKGEINDNSAYDETVVIAGSTGTDSATNYVWLTGGASNSHVGVAGTSHARLATDTASGHCITVSEDYFRLSKLEIKQISPGTSDEGIRVTSNMNDVVLEKCIIWTDSATADTDGIYSGNWAVSSLNIDNCAVYGWARGGMNLQNYDSSNTAEWNIDFCTIIGCGATGEVESGGIVNGEHSDSTTIINVYNTFCGDTASTYQDFNGYDHGGGGTPAWTGTNNACTDGSLTSEGIATNAQESLTVDDSAQGSGSYFLVVSEVGGSEDYNLLDDSAANKAYGNAINRVGSEPDARQDFSIDIVGNARSTASPGPDIGAFEFIASGGGRIMGGLAYHGGLAGKGGIAGIGGGLAA